MQEIEPRPQIMCAEMGSVMGQFYYCYGPHYKMVVVVHTVGPSLLHKKQEC